MSESNEYNFEISRPIKGYPELHWTGKTPYKHTMYYPAQLKEKYGDEKDGWLNKIFWGDNLQVMSHMLKDYRGKIDLIYIDPPFDSKADYKKKIKTRGKEVFNDNNSFEEKQYGDIWTNDGYLQFMYERLILCRELLSDKGSIYLHCDWHKSHLLRMLMDEVFGVDNFINEIIWHYASGGVGYECFSKKHDNILFYAKDSSNKFLDITRVKVERTEKSLKRAQNPNGARISVDNILKLPDDVWDIAILNPQEIERTGYPTQKPEKLVEKIILATSNPGDIVFDCFMGSGTTQAVAMKLGRRFIGADINYGAIDTTTNRLLNIAKELTDKEECYTGFEVYNVNNYDFFRNPVEARDPLIDALQIQKFEKGYVYDGELDGRMVKILPVNRMATRADLSGFIENLPYSTFENRKNENPLRPVEKITFVCMGHESSLKADFEREVNYNIDVEIIDILRDKRDLQLKRESDAKIIKKDGKLIIEEFYPMNLLQKLSIQKERVDNWRELVETIKIDWNYDGAVMEPMICDIPEKNELVKGEYDIPENASKIRVKITDVLSESLEVEV